MTKVLTWTGQTLVVPFGAKFYVRCASIKVTHTGARSAPISKNKVPLDSRCSVYNKECTFLCWIKKILEAELARAELVKIVMQAEWNVPK